MTNLGPRYAGRCLVSLLLALLIVAGCAGGGRRGGGGGGGNQRQPSAVSGQVLSPNGVLASPTIKTQSIATASVQVTLAVVDDVGQGFVPFAGSTTSTDANGRYSIVLPTNVSPASNLLVIVGAVNSPSMYNIVTGLTIDIRPASTAAVNLLFARARTRMTPISLLNVRSVETYVRAAVQAAVISEQGPNVAAAVAASDAAIQASAAANAALDAATPVLVPTLRSITPNSGNVGTSVNVTLTGTNFASSATVNVSGMGVTVRDLQVVSRTQITATFDIAANAAPGNRNVTVRVGDSTSGAQSFAVMAATGT